MSWSDDSEVHEEYVKQLHRIADEKDRLKRYDLALRIICASTATLSDDKTLRGFVMVAAEAAIYGNLPGTLTRTEPPLSNRNRTAASIGPLVVGADGNLLELPIKGREPLYGGEPEVTDEE